MSFNSILVPVEFDEGAKTALDLAKRMALSGESTIHLLHVMAILLTPGEGASAVMAREDEVKAALEKMGRDHLRGFRFQIHLRTGDTARGIVEQAHALHADLIVMPTHGRHGLPHFFLGSVAERVVREAPCPVLTIRPSAADADGETTVGAVMSKHPPAVGSSDSLADAQAAMQRHELLSMPVVDGAVLAGIITDRDIRSHAGALEKTPVRAAMASGPVTVAPTMPIAEAARLLMKLGVGALPVVENGKLVGLLSTRDVIGALLERKG